MALFAGAGGGILGGRLLGWRTRCAVEIDPYCRSVLFQRQRDGILDPFPIWDDVRTFDGRPWRGRVEVISGGFPCQDISAANHNAKGLGGSRSGLWFEMARIVGEVRPSFVFVENSPRLRTRGLSTVVRGLAELGYDSRWCVLGARHVGAPHRRDRLWLLAHANYSGQREQPFNAEVAGSQKDVRGPRDWWSELGSPRMAHGLAHRMDRVRATGNGQVPAVAALTWRVLTCSSQQ